MLQEEKVEVKHLTPNCYSMMGLCEVSLNGLFAMSVLIIAGKEHASVCKSRKRLMHSVEVVNSGVFPSSLSPGRASLHGKASLQIDPVRSEDQGWYECRVLMLEQQYDTFHNGSWVHLTVNGESPAHGAWEHVSVGVNRKKKRKTCVIHLSSMCNKCSFLEDILHPTPRSSQDHNYKHTY